MKYADEGYVVIITYDNWPAMMHQCFLFNETPKQVAIKIKCCLLEAQVI